MNNEIKEVLKFKPDTLKVNEIFTSIQGEGINTGVPSVFIRFALCNLQCWKCFVRNTLIATPTGYKRISDIQVGDIVYGFDAAKITTTLVINVFQHTVSPDEICKVVFGYKKIFCTFDHEFYVKDKGWTFAKDLIQGDIVYDIPQSYISSQRMQKDNPMKDLKVSQKVSKTLKAKYDSGELIPFVRTAALRKVMSDKRKINNPMKNPEVAKKNAMSHFRKGPSSLEQNYIKRFKDLPIEFVGNNKLPIGNKTDRYIFPDFKITGKNKVIEVYHTTAKYMQDGGRVFKFRDSFWEETRKNFLKKFGYDVIFLTEKDLSSWESKVIPFINNGKKVDKVELNLSSKERARLDYPVRRSKDTPVIVYNIETETHNYYANSVLVHNCDTPYTWCWKGTKSTHIDHKQYDPRKEITEMTPIEIITNIRKLADKNGWDSLTGYTINNIVLTGGEPLIYTKCKSFLQLLRLLKMYKFNIEVETNGTIAPTKDVINLVDQFNVSPKLTSFNPDQKCIRVNILKIFNNLKSKSWFKFVVKDEKDIEEIIKIQKECSIPSNRILLMPEGRTDEDTRKKSQEIVKLCLKNGYRFCNRLHIWIWDGSLRGV